MPDRARMPSVAVCVSSYRRPHMLPRLIAALEAQTLPLDEFEVVIVDNGSGDETMSVLEGFARTSKLRLRPLQIAVNNGPAAARNAAWRASTAAIVAFTDDDCVPDPMWLAEGLATLERDPLIGIAQGRTEMPVGSEHYEWTDWTLTRHITEPTPWFEGCNLFVRREALEASGGFDEQVGFYCEETSMGWSILSHGWSRAFSSGAVVRHDLEERGITWHMRERFKEQKIPYVAARYPAIAEEFWRPWAVERRGALHALAVLGGLAALKRPAAIALAIPYALERRPPRAHPRFVRLLAERTLVDTVRLAGMLIGSVKNRRFLI